MRMAHPFATTTGIHTSSGVPGEKWSWYVSTLAPAFRTACATTLLPKFSSRKRTVGLGGFAELFPPDGFVDFGSWSPIVLGELIRRVASYKAMENHGCPDSGS